LDAREKLKLRGLLNKIENLYKQAGADRRRTGSVRVDMLLNRCIKHVETLKYMDVLPPDVKRAALEYAWHVYMDLQEFNPNRERQDLEIDRESSLTDVLKQIQHLEERGDAIPRGMYSGGRGYRSVNWDSSYWMAETKGDMERNEYWNEEEGRKKRPVKVYTKKELKKFQ
jgi:hypothetical protein